MTPRKSEATVKMSDAEGPKKLVIGYDENNIPIFDFSGKWTGRDLIIVSRLLLRAYRRNQRTVRRDTPIVNKEETT